MAAASPVARSLLALACFALLWGICTAGHKQSQNANNCAEYMTGEPTIFKEVLDPINTPPYEIHNTISNRDHCSWMACDDGKLDCLTFAVGSLVRACDLFGPYPPVIVGVDILTQAVSCIGPCPGGLVVSVTQYCNI